jgi:hypothetical protein
VGDGFGEGGVDCLAVHDDGSGASLYAGGTFTSAGGVAAARIARWDGHAWHPLGTGMERPGEPFVNVAALKSFDDGTGPALYAGGLFTVAGGVAASHVARWSGTAWSALGAGLDGSVAALEVFDDGTGPALYAGGYFNHSGATNVAHVAKWDGSLWLPLGTGVDDTVRSLAVVDLGSGPALFAGGDFTIAGSVYAPRRALER